MASRNAERFKQLKAELLHQQLATRGLEGQLEWARERIRELESKINAGGAVRYVILKQLSDLQMVAALWPIGAIEDLALWVVPADSQAEAERFGQERFPHIPHVVIGYEEAASLVRQELANIRRRRAA